MPGSFRSSAALAGMLDGDRIVKFGGREVKGQRELVTAIRAVKPNSEVEVVVLVDGSATASVVEVARSALLTGATARASTAEATRPEIG